VSRTRAIAGAGYSGDRQAFVLCRRNAAEHNRSISAAQAISADLIGSNGCSAFGITARGYTPMSALCRLLIEAGHHPNRPLLAYRGITLCLRVRSIAEGAALTVEDDRLGTPRFRRWRARGDGVGPHVAQTRKAGQTTSGPKSRTGGAIPAPGLDGGARPGGDERTPQHVRYHEGEP
jgi:hypothetical protein